MSFWKLYKRFAVVALPGSVVLVVAGLVARQRGLLITSGILAGLVALPWVLMLAFGLLIALLFAVLVPFQTISDRRKERKNRERVRQLMQELDRLDRAADPQKILEEVRSFNYRDDPEVLSRVRDRNHPHRVPLVEFVSLEVLSELARRPDDPLAPWAWKLAIIGTWLPSGKNVRSDLPPHEIEKLWRLALGSADPFRLPPELDGGPAAAP